MQVVIVLVREVVAAVGASGVRTRLAAAVVSIERDGRERLALDRLGHRGAADQVVRQRALIRTGWNERRASS